MQKISHVIFLLIILSHVSTRINAQQCNATASANGGTAVVDICYGDQVTLSATGGCPNYVLNNDFNMVHQVQVGVQQIRLCSLILALLIHPMVLFTCGWDQHLLLLEY